MHKPTCPKKGFSGPGTLSLKTTNSPLSLHEMFCTLPTAKYHPRQYSMIFIILRQDCHSIHNRRGISSWKLRTRSFAFVRFDGISRMWTLVWSYWRCEITDERCFQQKNSTRATITREPKIYQKKNLRDCNGSTAFCSICSSCSSRETIPLKK
jgi:hypothetical protein